MGGLEKPVRGWADGNRKASMARSDATNAGWWNIGKRARQATIRGSRKRELKAAAWKEEGNAAFNQNIIENSESLSRGLPADGAGAAYIRAVAARAQSEEVKLSMDSMKLEAGFNPNDRAALARTLADAIKSGETTRATAATNYLVAARGVDELHSTLKGAQASGYINDGPNATDSQRAMATAMQRAMTSSENGGVIKERRVDLTTWGAKGGSIQNIETNPSTWRVSAEDAAGLSSGALKAAMDAGPNGLSPEIAQRVLDTPQLRAKLDPTKENFMLSIAGRVAPRKVGPIGSEGTPSQS